MVRSILHCQVAAALAILSISTARAQEVQGAALPGDGVAPMRGLEEVDHGHVVFDGGFWGRRLRIHHEVTIPHALDALERAGHVTNFDVAAGVEEGQLHGNHAFDSDLYKAMEGVWHLLRNVDDPELSRRAEGILDRILAAQQDDGYLNSWFTVRGLEGRWRDLRLQHEMYNAGHFFEMAVAHHRTTGDPRALQAAMRFADHIDGIFGEDRRHDVGGHEEIELALIGLYRATGGEARYLDLCRFLLDERGCQHGVPEHRRYHPSAPVEPPGAEPVDPSRAGWYRKLRTRSGRMQDHMPLSEQTEAVGHAVRAGYAYSAMADLARFSDAAHYARAVEALWRDVVGRKMFITGGIGTAQYGDEGFGDPYLLPNRAYCESCANIAHVFWQHRMNLLTGDAKYADVMELTLYNAALSGLAASGDAFFYQNPLESRTGARRRSWIGLACCPTNISRFVPQVGGFVHARAAGRLFVNLFARADAEVELDGVAVQIRQRTDYPWAGRVELTVTPQRDAGFELCLRIPGWASGRPVPSDLYRFVDRGIAPVSLAVNGEVVSARPEPDGYVHLARTWQAGDVVVLELPMEVRRVRAHDEVREDRGKVALMRGPVVYCFEAVDNPGVDLFEVTLEPDVRFAAEHRPDLLGGITVLRGEGRAAAGGAVQLLAIPYHAWANREQGAMAVWLWERQGGE
ncbi:MAG: glycoside hydrolase family 127 protein [Planctomycetes bacterium]|nr:glycoside hydrolase family 127 protein [Planctomycetota bacterium]